MRYRYALQLLGAFLLTLLPGIVSAETIAQDTATATNLGLYGGEVRDVASDPASDFLYITTYSPNGFFVSTNDGETWQGLDSEVYDLGEPRGVELDEDGNVYILMGDGVMKSSDNGSTLAVTGDVGAYGGTMIYNNNQLVVGRSDGAVSVSEDNGATFTTSEPIQDSSIVLSLTASPTPDTYYAVLDDNTNSTLYMSTNAGATWNPVNTDDVTNRFTTISVNPNDADHLIMLSYGEDVLPWQSFDGGATWEEFSGVSTPGYVNFDASGRIYVGTNYSDDNGATWDQINTITPANRVSNIWIDSSDDSRIYGSTFGAVAISTDRGENWIDSNEGITAVTVHDVAQSADKNTVWIATGAGLAKTTDYTADTPTWEFPINYDYYPSAVWVSPADSNLVVVGGYLAIYRTTDGGETWDTIDNWNSDYAVKALAADPNDPTILYAVGGIQNTLDALTGVVMQSTDSGATWTDLEITDDAAVQTIDVAEDGAVYVGAGALDIRGDSATGIYKYYGSTWTHLDGSPDEQITSIVADPDDATILYATASDFDSNQQTDGGVYKTTDAGTTWTALSSNPGLEEASHYRVITIQNSTNTLYMAGTEILSGAGTIWKSTDGGANWGIYYTGLQNETFNTLLFDGLIAGNSRGAYDIRGKVSLTLKKGIDKLTATLKDAATDKKLQRKKVTLWKKNNGSWIKIDSDRTNSKAKAIFRIHPNKKSYYQVRYTPTGVAAEEYSSKRSRTVTVRI